MSISNYNYEAYFLDYYEGRLDARATKELMDFIARHPELKEEFESFEPVSLKADAIKFEHKELLKKPVMAVNASNFDEIAAQYIEGMLNPEQQAQLLGFVKQNPEYENALALYRNTRLTPDTSIVFEGKELLKKGTPRRPVAWYYIAAAASVALLITAYFMFGTHTAPDTVKVALTHSHTDTVHTPAPVVQPSKAALNQTIVQNAPKHAHTHTKASYIAQHNSKVQQKNTAVAKTLVNKDSAGIALQNKTLIHKPDTANAVIINHFIVAHKPQDTLVNSVADIKHDTTENMVRVPEGPVKSKKPVFAFATNTLKKIGGIFRHKIGINKYYSKASDKIIAYQLTVGDNRYTLRLKNNAY